jgi:hypothetical protein
LIAASLLWLNASNALHTAKIGVSTTVDFCGGAVRLHIGSIEGIDKGDIVPYKKSRAAIDKRSLI